MDTVSFWIELLQREDEIVYNRQWSSISRMAWACFSETKTDKVIK